MTPDPTLDEVRASLNECGGCPRAVWDEILRILKQDLPGVISAANARFGLRLPQLAGYIVDGQDAPVAFPYASIGASFDTHWMGGSFADEGNIVLSITHQGGLLGRLDLDAIADLACLARALLCWYAGPQGDPDGRAVWNSLVPTALAMAPSTGGDTKAWGQMILHLRASQYPEQGVWTPGSVEPMTAPTPEEVLDSLPACGGRLSLARAGILEITSRLLKDLMPGLQDSTRVKMHQPQAFYVLGQEIQQLPSLCVGAVANTRGEGARAFSDEITVAVYSLFGGAETRLSRSEMSDCGSVVRALLHCYRGGYTDSAGRSAWSELAPERNSFARVPWENARGTMTSYKLFQGPGESRW